MYIEKFVSIDKEPGKNLMHTNTCYHDILACLRSAPQHIVTVMREALVEYEDLKIKSMGKLTIYTVETIFSLAKPKVK